MIEEFFSWASEVLFALHAFEVLLARFILMVEGSDRARSAQAPGPHHVANGRAGQCSSILYGARDESSADLSDVGAY
jgi:hypothetical protein